MQHVNVTPNSARSGSVLNYQWLSCHKLQEFRNLQFRIRLRPMPVLCRKEWIYRHTFWRSDSGVILVVWAPLQNSEGNHERKRYIYGDMIFFCKYRPLSVQETQLSLTNRATRLSSKNTVTFKPELGVTEGHWKCHHSIQRMRLPIDVQ